MSNTYLEEFKRSVTEIERLLEPGGAILGQHLEDLTSIQSVVKGIVAISSTCVPIIVTIRHIDTVGAPCHMLSRPLASRLSSS